MSISSGNDTIQTLNKLMALRERVKECLFDNNCSNWNEKTIDPNSIFDFADILSKTIHAPNGWSETIPLIGVYPPAPQALQIRRGMLYEIIQNQNITANNSTVDVPMDTDEKLGDNKVQISTLIDKDTTCAANIDQQNRRIKVEDQIVKEKEMNALPTQEQQQQEKPKSKMGISFGLSDSDDSDTE